MAKSYSLSTAALVPFLGGRVVPLLSTPPPLSTHKSNVLTPGELQSKLKTEKTNDCSIPVGISTFDLRHYKTLFP